MNKIDKCNKNFDSEFINHLFQNNTSLINSDPILIYQINELIRCYIPVV